MKKLLIALGCATLLFAAPAYAQNSSKPDREQVMQISGSLKEAHGILSKSLAMLDREIAGAEAASAEQKAERAEYVAKIAELESMLTAVNTADQAQWAEVKEKAETCQKQAAVLAERRQKR